MDVLNLQSLAAADEPLFLPLVALGELYRGVLKSARPEFNRAKVDEFLEIAAVLSPDVAAAEIYADRPSARGKGYAHSGERHLDCSCGIGMRNAARYP